MKFPKMGLCCTLAVIPEGGGKEKLLTYDLVPFKPIHESLYLCDKRFHTEVLQQLVDSESDGVRFGFIVIDGNGTLYGVVSGNNREVVDKFSVSLPKKHGRGGQSAARFERLSAESRQNYIRKAAELAVKHFIDPATNMPNVGGLILAGCAAFKMKLSRSDLFDPRLKVRVVKVLDISYGGECRFNQAIELSSEVLSNLKFVQQKCLIGKFFEEISLDSGKFVYGLDDTIGILQTGAVETLIVWEDLDVTRYVLKNSRTNEILIKHLTKVQEADASNFQDSTTQTNLEVQDQMSLVEWLIDEYKQFGCLLEIVSNNSQEGSQFCKGFGGIGGILRYPLDITPLYESETDEF